VVNLSLLVAEISSYPRVPILDELPEAAFREFIRTHVARADAAPATVENYLREARFFREHLILRGIALSDLRSTDLREWVAGLVEAGLKPTTIGAKLAGVRRLLDAAVDRGVLAMNPAKGIAGPRDRRITGAAAQRTLTTDEVRTVLRSTDLTPATGDRDRALLALLVGHGLRSVELERLSLCDVDLDSRTIVAHGKVRDRIVHLRVDTAERLAVLYRQRVTEGAGADGAIFVNQSRSRHGERLTRRGIRFIVDRAFAFSELVDRAPGRGERRPQRRAAAGAKTAARALGQRVPTVHGLRATCATLARRGGAKLEHIQSDLGHADPRTTARYFAEDDRRANNSALHIPVEF
jgi:integrase/recombinase XerD